MTFLAPDRLYALLGVVALALAYVLTSLARRSYTVRFTNLALLDVVAPQRPGWRRHLSALAFLAGLALLLVAWARPADEVEVAKERATVVLAIDTSLSMEADDVDPNRLVAAQQAALRFVNDLPEGMNLGLVTFDGVARVRVAPMDERTPVRSAIQGLELGQATAIGEAIFAGLDAIDALTPTQGDEPVPARIVLMTDGQTTVGRPDADAAEAAAEAGVPVSTIAFGTDRGSIVIDGQLQPVPVETERLRRIAEMTGGEFFTAETLDELASVYEDIGSSIGFEIETVEVTERYVGYAALALVGATLLSLVWFQRVP